MWTSHRIGSVVLGATVLLLAGCRTEVDDTTELQDLSEEREEEVDEGVNQGQTDEDQGDLGVEVPGP